MQDLQQLNAQLSGQQPTMQEEAPMESPSWMEDDDDRDIAGLVEENLNNLNDQQRSFVIEHLTPETAMLIALVSGDDDVAQALEPYVDQSRILVPIPREVAMQRMQQGPAQVSQAGAPQAAPQAPQMPAPQGTPPAPM